MKKLFKLTPTCKDFIWGGTKLISDYGKVTSNEKIAETWELSFHKAGPSFTQSGKKLSAVVSKKHLGANIKDFLFFPTLIKFIDAHDNLSVQVHPSDDYALKYENSFGKTEMWYIIEAEKGAGIYLGFKETISQDDFKKAIENKTLTDAMNFFEVKKGECYFIPSGTLHAIGKGCVICEIQQNSNLTYRVYDYGRKDKFGKERELHIDKAIKVTDLNKFTYSPVNISRGKETVIGLSKYFTVSKAQINGTLPLAVGKKSFLSINCVDGCGVIKFNRSEKKISKGDTFFLPANAGKLSVKGELTVLITRIKKYSAVSTENGITLKDDGGFTVAESKDGNLKKLLTSVKMTESDLQ